MVCLTCSPSRHSILVFFIRHVYYVSGGGLDVALCRRYAPGEARRAEPLGGTISRHEFVGLN